MKTNLETAISFAKKTEKIGNILQIVLFGSVASGEDTPHSDIDIAIIHNSNDKYKLMSEVNKNKPEKVQTTFININELASEAELVGALSGEGLLLYGSPISIQEKKLKLQPKVLINYSLVGMLQTEKVKVNRSLYGSYSESTANDKKYVTKTRGVANRPGIQKINNSVLLAERKLALQIIKTLKLFKVNYKTIPFWTY